MRFIWEPEDIQGGRKYWSNAKYAEGYMLSYFGSNDEIYGVSLLDGNLVKLGQQAEAAEKLTQRGAIPFTLAQVPEDRLARLQQNWDAQQQG